MFYTIYKITNLINDKIYIGCHKTNNLDDGYMGSGVHLKRAQEKYGIENFQKEILEVFENSETMFEMEAKLVNYEFVDRDDTYNLKEGGHGGFDYINNIGKNMYGRNTEILLMYRELGVRISQEIRNDVEASKIWYEKLSNGLKNYYSNGGINPFKGRTHTDETKKKIGEANSKYQKGEGNSQFGTMWIHNLEEKLSKKIKKDEFSDWEAKGWLKGRKMKFI